MQTITLADGTYRYTRPAMGPRDATVTVEILGGQITEGIYNGQPMTSRCWRACALADLSNLPFEFTPDPRALLGKARAARLDRVLARLGLSSADHYRTASTALVRTVDSLAALTEAEARRVWNYAHSIRLAYQQAA